jgi:predicted ribosomally synthesized peptide with nif11-like leader
MSKADIERFADDVKKNPALREELEGKNGIPAVLGVATQHGYEITQDDLVAYAQSQNPELSNKELNAVAGGAGSTFVVNATRFDPYKSFKFRL